MLEVTGANADGSYICQAPKCKPFPISPHWGSIKQPETPTSQFLTGRMKLEDDSGKVTGVKPTLGDVAALHLP